MYDIFISYRRKSGSEFASFLTASLTDLGYEVFFDAQSLREGPFEEKISKAIEQCTWFLLLLAPNDLDRSLKIPENDWIIHESKCALEAGKIIIPISIKPNFEFPKECSEPTIAALSKLNICSLSGCNAAELVHTKLLEFITDSPAKILASKYYDGIISPQYKEWEFKTLRSIYNDIPFVSAFGKEYPVYTIDGSPEVTYPFNSLTRKGTLGDVEPEIDFENSIYYRDFKKIVGPNVHYPNLYGYACTGFNFDEDGKIFSINSVPRKYRETVYTCHILQYELWRVYEDLQGQRLATLDDLPLRKSIHQNKKNIDVILSGCNRSALNDIAIAVIDYNERTEEYGIACATRTRQVATLPGYFGFIPSGGFELYELEENQDENVIKENYLIIGALFREYIEELFGDENFGSPTGNDDLNRLYRNPKVHNLREGVVKGTYKFEFLGVSFDLITLRQTISFILRIDDENFFYENEIRKNEENSFVRFESLKNLENIIMAKNTPVMNETAATYQMLKSNHLYKEILDNDYKLIR